MRRELVDFNALQRIVIDAHDIARLSKTTCKRAISSQATFAEEQEAKCTKIALDKLATSSASSNLLVRLAKLRRELG